MLDFDLSTLLSSGVSGVLVALVAGALLLRGLFFWW